MKLLYIFSQRVLKFSLLKKILTFALRIVSTFKNSLTKINEASNCSYLRNELNVTRKEVKSFCKYVNKDTRLLSLNFEKYPHFSVKSQQVFFSGSLKVCTNQDLGFVSFQIFFGKIKNSWKLRICFSWIHVVRSSEAFILDHQWWLL